MRNVGNAAPLLLVREDKGVAQSSRLGELNPQDLAYTAWVFLKACQCDGAPRLRATAAVEGMANALGEEPLDGPEREGLTADFDTNGDETIDEHEFIEGNRRLGQFFARSFAATDSTARRTAFSIAATATASAARP